jgi:hypothetical protein
VSTTRASTKTRPPKAKAAAVRRAFYEGATGSVARSVLPGLVQEARKDLTRATRRELIRNSRALQKNNPLVLAIVERMVTYTVGTGIFLEPASSSPEYNKAAAAYLRERYKAIDTTGQHSAGALQQIAFRGLLVDGGSFLLKTYTDAGRRAVQVLEEDRCGSADALFSVDGNDGIELTKGGAPVSYFFEERTLDGLKLTPRDAGGVVYMANRPRAGQGRGLCLAAAALTTAIDLHDILGIEKYAVKDASTKVDIIETENGEAPAPTIGRAARAAAEAAGAGNPIEYYHNVFGPESKVVKRGDKYTPYEPKRPGPAWQGFVDFLAELVCLSFNLPPSLVRQLKVGGVDTRRDLATMQRVAEVWQEYIAKSWQPFHEYFLEEANEAGVLPAAPADWKKAEALFPRAATADAGRMAQQDREDVRTGNMTMRESCGQYGTPWRAHVNQLCVELAAVLEDEGTNKLPRGTIANRLFGPIIADRIKEMRDELDAYGVGVRAGVLTPNADDEKFFRAKFGMPAMSAAVLAAWKADGDVRKPITLAAQVLTDANAAAAGANTGAPAQ